jgi:hypothetical protein
METDDGFVIGSFTPATFVFIAAVTGGVTLFFAPIHALVRRWVPSSWRVLTFALVLGLFGGSELVHSDGMDFRVLTPQPLAVGLFVALPAAFGAAVEPLHRLQGWTRRVPNIVAALVAVAASCVFGLAVRGVVGLVLVLIGWAVVVLTPAGSVVAAVTSRPAVLVGRAGLLLIAGLGARGLAEDVAALF